MGKTKKTSRMELYRVITQSFFILFSIFLFLRFQVSHDFMLIAASIIILITIVFRSGFCGWLCPLGLISDGLRALGKKIGGITSLKSVNKRYKKWVKKNRGLLLKVDKGLRYLKYLLLLWILQAAFLDIASISSGWILLASFILILAFVVILNFFVDRAWCRYLCPVGATFGFVSLFSPTKVARNEQTCISCKLCTKSCPMGIDVAEMSKVNDSECITCLKCVDACPVEGALELKMNLPFTEGKKGIQTTEIINK